MSTAQLLGAFALWYVPGFLAAARMIRRGHDPATWLFAAWVGGALTLVAVVAFPALWATFRSGPEGDLPEPGRHHVIDLTDGPTPTHPTPRNAPPAAPADERLVTRR